MGYEPHLGLRALEHTTALIIASLVSYLLQELTQPNKQGNGTEGSEEERVPLTLPYEEEVVRTTPQLPPYQNHARHALNRSPEPKPVQTSGEANNNNNNNDPEQLI
ncbi:hypothetical protein ADEAN_000771300 [Angomonas deanei]|uniref:Uncharacterized protein n=1 Tax=Angomonas deanei TaxID=59799 RepID=A0A7G2CK07_9TRYP|nr:hypothetical protein ADEAN_000771300 [Angomonas deanei]